MTNDPERRWAGNGSEYKYSHHLYRAIQKYGWDNFDHELLGTGLTYDEACELEIRMIQELNTIEDGYNLSEGGQGGKVWRVHPLSTPVKVTATNCNTYSFPTIKSCAEYFDIPVRTMQNIVHRDGVFELNYRTEGRPEYENIRGFLFEVGF